MWLPPASCPWTLDDRCARSGSSPARLLRRPPALSPDADESKAVEPKGRGEARPALLPVDPWRAECGGVANMLMPSLPAPPPTPLLELWLLLEDSPAPERNGLRGDDFVPLSSNSVLPLPTPRGVRPNPPPPLSPRLRELPPPDPSSSIPTGKGGANGSELPVPPPWWLISESKSNSIPNMLLPGLLLVDRELRRLSSGGKGGGKPDPDRECWSSELLPPAKRNALLPLPLPRRLRGSLCCSPGVPLPAVPQLADNLLLSPPPPAAPPSGIPSPSDRAEDEEATGDPAGPAAEVGEGTWSGWESSGGGESRCGGEVM